MSSGRAMRTSVTSSPGHSGYPTLSARKSENSPWVAREKRLEIGTDPEKWSEIPTLHPDNSGN